MRVRSLAEDEGRMRTYQVLPLLLVLGTPVYAEAMRQSLRLWPHFFAFSLLLALLAALVIEQALIPRHLMARRYGFERLLGFSLSASLLGLFAAAVWRLAAQRAAVGDSDGEMICYLLLAPLLWFLLLHLSALRPREWFAPSPQITPPPGEQLRLVSSGAEITLHRVPPLPLKSRLLRGGMKLAFIFAAAGAAAWLAGEGGDLEGMVLAVFAGITGAALAGLLLQGLAPRTVIHIRQGFIRFGRARFGGVFGGSPWLKRMSAGRDAALFDAAEWQWLHRVREGGNA